MDWLLNTVARDPVVHYRSLQEEVQTPELPEGSPESRLNYPRTWKDSPPHCEWQTPVSATV